MRPTGVTIIGVLQIIGGILRILGALTLLGLVGLGLAGDVNASVTAWGFIVGIASLVIALAYFYLGWSMLALRPWAWTVTLLLNLFTIVVVVIQLITNGFDWNVVAGLVIPVIIVIYLYSQNVKRAFGK